VFGVGAYIGPYQLVAELGRGGMATLFLGLQTGLGGFSRHVAIKIIHPEIASDPETIRMFLDEARLGGSIRHPNVARVEAIAEHDGWPYLVMEYIEGATLTQILRARARAEAPLPLEHTVAIIARIAEALHAAHEATDELGSPLGIVHRDVSPSNVLIDTHGHVKLIDFGVAKARHRLARTMPGSVKGKLAYMAPEQLAGSDLDRRVDVFALGVVLWEMLTLRRLFHAATDIETIMKIRETAPVVPPSSVRPEVSPRLDDVVGTMLARDLEERFCTTAAARHALLVTCPAATLVDSSTLAQLAAQIEAPADVEELTVPARPAAKPG
jgi:serine/threonine-protein kinase